MSEHDKVDEPEAVVILMQILEGIKHLHDKNILHMDLKPENLMLIGRDSSRLKIIDFGLSRRLSNNIENHEMVGTAEFVAPEVINYDALCLATDMWSIGVIAYILLSGYSPFLGNTKQETLSNVSAIKYSLDNEYFYGISSSAKDFISQLLIREPRKRLTVNDCLGHTWIKMNLSFLDPACDKMESNEEVIQLVNFSPRTVWKRCICAVQILIYLKKLVMKKTERIAVAEANHEMANGPTMLQTKVLDSVKEDEGKFELLLALHLAAKEGKVLAFQELLDKMENININIDKQDGFGLILVAASGGHLAIMKCLHERNFDLNAADQGGTTALHTSSCTGLLEMVQFLCDVGVDVNLQNQDGDTALHLAASCGHVEVVRCLLFHRADMELVNKKGQSSHDISLTMGIGEVIDILSRMKRGRQKFYINQLGMTNIQLGCIRVKVMGHSGVGKTKLMESLKFSLFGGLFQKAFQPKMNTEVDQQHANHIMNGTRNGIKSSVSSLSIVKQWTAPPHDNYTRGVNIEKVNISGVDCISLWEFSGYEPYFIIYDSLIGDANCLYMIVVDGSEPEEIQLNQITFWLNFIKARTLLKPSIGFAGSLPYLPTVLLVATHAESIKCYKQSASNYNSDIGTSLLVQTLTQMFSSDFHIFPHLFVLNAHHPASNAMKALRQTIGDLKRSLCQSLPSSHGLLEAVLMELPAWRRKLVLFPVVTWSRFVALIRSQVNVLASFHHLRSLIYQLQVLGEVIYIERLNDDDFVILNPSWLGSTLIGSLFSFDHLACYPPDGRFSIEDFHVLYPSLDFDGLLSVLEAVDICSKWKNGNEVEIEFPCLSIISDACDAYAIFKQNRPDYVHGGVRIVTQRSLAGQVSHIFPKVQVRLRQHSLSSHFKLENISLFNFHHHSVYICNYLRVLVTLVSDDQMIDIRSCGPSSENTALYHFQEEICNIICDLINECCPGFNLERHLLSCKELKSSFGTVHAYCPKDIHEAQLSSIPFVSLPGKTREHESICDLIAFGSVEVFSQLTPGIQLHASQLSLQSRRNLSHVVDPPDASGRDWCLLAMLLGLDTNLPELEGAESPTDASITLWSRDPKATVKALIEKLRGLNRQDAVDALLSCHPLFVYSSKGLEPITGSASDNSDLTPSSISSR